MKIEIKHRWSGSILFSLETDSLKLCVEAAVKSGADLTGADLTGADLMGADLRGAYLTGADLTGADLTGAYLTGADLTGADLTGADLRGAYLRGAYLTGADVAAIRSRKIGMEQLREWKACTQGMEWVKSTLGDSVSCADLYAHGMDSYLVWLEGRVIMLVMKELEGK